MRGPNAYEFPNLVIVGGVIDNCEDQGKTKASGRRVVARLKNPHMANNRFDTNLRIVAYGRLAEDLIQISQVTNSILVHGRMATNESKDFGTHAFIIAHAIYDMGEIDENNTSIMLDNGGPT